MKILPLTVLVYEGPMARAYLARLNEAKFRPAHILHLILDHHPATKQRFPLWLPKSLRVAICERIQQKSLMHWPRTLFLTYPWLTNSLKEALESHYGNISQTLNAIANPTPLETYSDSIEKVLISNFKDPALANILSSLAHKTVLFTGGGIMPRELFEIPGIRYLHVHPGHLPEIRGADGFLWSLLVREMPGASCFYMNAGLDMGDLIITENLPAPIFKLPKNITRPDDQILYRILFSYCDPLLRADVFVRMIQKIPHISDSTLASLLTSKQKKEEGITYHFMHPLLRKAALQKLFV